MKKLMAILLATGMTASLFAGCSGGGESSSAASTDSGSSGSEASAATSEAAAASGEDVTLSFYLWDQNMLDGIERRQAMVQEQYPNISFENTVLPWEQYWTKLQTSLPSANGPDVFECEANHTSEYGSLGFIEPLNDYIERDSFDMSVYTEGSKSLFTDPDGIVYGIPINYDNAALYYNKTLFDAAGVEYPKDGMTFEEFRELANKLTVRDGDTITQYGAIAGPQPQNAVYGLLLGNGVYPYGEDCLSSNFTDPAFKETIQFLSDMIFVDKVMPTANDLVNTSADQLFLSNMAAMYIMGPSVLKEFSEAMGDTFDLALPPMNKNQAISIMGMDICISTQSQHKEEAWQTLKVFGSEEAAAIEAEMMCPGYTSAKEVWEGNFPQYNMDAFTAAAEIGEAIIPKKKMGTVDQYFQDMLGYVYTGEKSVDEAIAEADEKIKAEFAA